MKKGDTVKIYQRPVTKEDYEGEAKLVSLINKNMYNERWEVKFANEPYTHTRTIFY